MRSLKFRNVHRKTPVLESKGLQLYKKETPAQVFSYEYYETFQEPTFYGTPPVAASEASGITMSDVELRRHQNIKENYENVRW